jgi:anthranilate phosphoribosyltransferase (EC 2.4.2.18)
MIKDGIAKLIKREDLSGDETERIFGEIMRGEATAAQIGAFITALRVKGETVDEITAAARVMRSFATHLNIRRDVILDTCGTGGSGTNRFNVSTIAALLAAGAGVTVAKHGNRSASGTSGSADLLEKLGVNIMAAPEAVEKCINEIGIGFLFAPTFHGAMRHAIGPRKEIGIRTIFNVLGPLTNPANATHQLLGVFTKDLTLPLARVLGNLGVRHALVVHGADGMDEVSLTAETFVSELRGGTVRSYTVTPEQFGFERAALADLQIKNPDESAAIARGIFEKNPGRYRIWSCSIPLSHCTRPMSQPAWKRVCRKRKKVCSKERENKNSIV